MTGIIKTDQLQGAQSTTVTVPTGHTLAVTSNATVGGTLSVTGDVTTTNTSGNRTLGIITGNSNSSILNMGDTDAANVGQVKYHHGINSMVLRTNGSDKVTLDSTGNLLFNAASTGVYLGVTSATASNLLDDYEEGHWTPTVGGWTSVTYSYRAASYVKIGHMCHVNCSIRFSGTSAGSTVQINGLPFLQELNASNHGSGTGAIGYQTLSTVTNHTVSTVYVVQGTTRVQLYTMAGSAVNASGNATDRWFEFSAVYPTQ